MITRGYPHDETETSVFGPNIPGTPRFTHVLPATARVAAPQYVQAAAPVLLGHTTWVQDNRVYLKR